MHDCSTPSAPQVLSLSSHNDRHEKKHSLSHQSKLINPDHSYINQKLIDQTELKEEPKVQTRTLLSSSDKCTV